MMRASNHSRKTRREENENGKSVERRTSMSWRPVRFFPNSCTGYAMWMNFNIFVQMFGGVYSAVRLAGIKWEISALGSGDNFSFFRYPQISISREMRGRREKIVLCVQLRVRLAVCILSEVYGIGCSVVSLAACTRFTLHNNTVAQWQCVCGLWVCARVQEKEIECRLHSPIVLCFFALLRKKVLIAFFRHLCAFFFATLFSCTIFSSVCAVLSAPIRPSVCASVCAQMTLYNNFSCSRMGFGFYTSGFI